MNAEVNRCFCLDCGRNFHPDDLVSACIQPGADIELVCPLCGSDNWTGQSIVGCCQMTIYRDHRGRRTTRCVIRDMDNTVIDIREANNEARLRWIIEAAYPGIEWVVLDQVGAGF